MVVSHFVTGVVVLALSCDFMPSSSDWLSPIPSISNDIKPIVTDD